MGGDRHETKHNEISFHCFTLGLRLEFGIRNRKTRVSY
jgi:hypothetical protein